jgi:CubicO group peptidase (beta-lactamase class C family)
MRSVAAGELSARARVSEVLPELAGAPAAHARLDDLLSHRAGLPAWGALQRVDPWGARAPASLPSDDPELAALLDGSLACALHEVGRACVSRMLERAASRIEDRPTGREAAPLYSDIGYVLAGAMIARAARAPLAAAWDEISGATSAAHLRARIGEKAFAERVLPTEHVEWRGGDVRGVVHDENAFALERAGGDPGHAGAFGTVIDVGGVAARFLDALGGVASDDLLPRALAEEMIAPRGGGSNRLGWDGVTIGASSSGTRMGPRAFGHLGFTGTSVWIDPDASLAVVLLTNRTYPSRENVLLRAVRPRLHDRLAELE